MRTATDTRCHFATETLREPSYPFTVLLFFFSKNDKRFAKSIYLEEKVRGEINKIHT